MGLFKIAAIGYLVSAMNFWVPLAPTAKPIQVQNAQELRRQIAGSILTVAFDPMEKPLFSGDDEAARMKTAIFMDAWFVEESHYHYLVDNGTKRGDKGSSWCIAQHNIGTGRTFDWNYAEYRFQEKNEPAGVEWGTPGAKVFKGFTGPEMIADRTKCVRAALRHFHYSVQVSKKFGITTYPDAFAAYATGKPMRGVETVWTRYRRAEEWLKNNPLQLMVENTN